MLTKIKIFLGLFFATANDRPLRAEELLKNKPLDSISDVIDQLMPLHVAFPNLLKELQIALTLSVSSAACERTFSSLKRIKTYLRSTMSDDRLTNLALLTIEKDLTTKLSLEDVVDKFSSSDRRHRVVLA